LRLVLFINNHKPIASMTSPLPTDAPVLVTGATGYFAGVLIRDLLEAGVTVHATVRDVDKTERYRHLLDLPRADGHLHIFKADLLKNKSFADAMEDCRIVFHTAFPYPAGKITDAYKESKFPMPD
jgi:dihydroflavonol-4-reductase